MRRTIVFYDKTDQTKYKAQIKTSCRHWLNTQASIILPFSIDSKIYDQREGFLKIVAFLELIKQNTKGKKTVLLCNKSHFYSLSLKYNQDVSKTLIYCNKKTKLLYERFQEYMKDFNVELWDQFLEEDRDYPFISKTVQDFYVNNPMFRSKLQENVKSTYTEERQHACPNYDIYRQKCELDLLEQCKYLLLASKKECRFQFYPGARHSAVEYLNHQLLSTDQRLTAINVKLRSPIPLEGGYI